MLSHSPEQTEQTGASLAPLLRDGDTLWLYGELGAGKTAFARGVARGLGVTSPVLSPTYAIANEYEGRLRLYHYDAYRLAGLEELLDTGFDGFSGGVRLVEWAERAGEDISGICVMFTVTGEEEREINLCCLP